MKSAQLPLARVALLALAALPFVSACKTETYESGTSTGKSVRQAADGIDRGVALLDATIKSLTDLVKNPAADAAPQFKLFSKNLAALESEVEDVKKVTADMERNGDAYFAKWDEQIAAIANEDIKERSVDRREKVSKAFQELRTEYAELRDEYKPLLADLKDVRSALAADLTPSGIEAVKKPASKIADRAEDAQESLTKLAAKFRELGVGIGAAAPPPPQKTTK